MRISFNIWRKFFRCEFGSICHFFAFSVSERKIISVILRSIANLKGQKNDIFAHGDPPVFMDNAPLETRGVTIIMQLSCGQDTLT